MTDRTNRQPDDDVEVSTWPSPRTIPDGNLGSTMPDWMRQAPSWKKAPEPEPEPEPKYEPVRPIPAPDTSVIDPRSLIAVDDLPEWLQAVSSRPTGTRQTIPAPPDVSEPSTPDVDESVPAVVRTEAIEISTWDREPDPVDAAPNLLAPVMEVESPAERSGHVRLTPSPAVVTRPWWMSDIAVGFLFVAIVLTMIYVILAASGVI